MCSSNSLRPPAYLMWLQRNEEDGLARSLRAEESRAKFDYIRSRADAVNEQQEAKREALLKKLEVCVLTRQGAVFAQQRRCYNTQGAAGYVG